jgi:hypothetical protein
MYNIIINLKILLINIWPTYDLPVRTEAGRKSTTRRVCRTMGRLHTFKSGSHFIPTSYSFVVSRIFRNQVNVKVVLTPMISRPVCLGVTHQSGAHDRISFTVKSCWFVHVGRLLWLEARSLVYNCYWPSPGQSFSGPILTGLTTIFICLRYENPSTLWVRSSFYVPQVKVKVKSRYDWWSVGQSVSMSWRRAHFGTCDDSWSSLFTCTFDMDRTENATSNSYSSYLFHRRYLAMTISLVSNFLFWTNMPQYLPCIVNDVWTSDLRC